MEKFTSKLPNIIYIIVILSIILLGITYKTDIWLHTDGLFYDEAALLMNIKERSFWGLFLPLGYSQCAPASFLILTKIVYSFFGLNETALYFIPYISGVLTLILCAFLGNKIFKLKSLNIVFLTLLSVNTVINDYSQALKQYSTDMFFAVLILLLFLNFKDKIESKKSILIIGFLEGLMCFISFTSQFIILPMLGYLIFKLVKNNKKELIIYLILPYLALVCIQFFMLVLGTLSDTTLTTYWQEKEYALSSFSAFISTIVFLVDGWGINIFIASKAFIIGFLFFLGLIELCTKEKLLAYLLITPFTLNAISGLLGLYPFADRVILYLAPLTMIICLKAFDFLTLKNKKTETIFFLIFLAFFIISYDRRRKPFYNEENYYYFICTNAREYVNKLNSQDVKKDDIIILDNASNVAFQLYDKEKKYSQNILYEENIENLKDGQNFYIYYNKNFNLPEKHRQIGAYLENNAKILYKKSDLFGDFLYIKK